jgi:hypothetical protein
MLFRALTDTPVTKTQFFAFSIQNAKSKIVQFHMGVTEIALDKYLKKHYKVGLKPMCFALLNKLKVSQISDTELVFTFIDEDTDKLAQFITYGDGVLAGSEILTQALVRKRRR